MAGTSRVIEQAEEQTGPMLNCDLFAAPMKPDSYVAQVQIPNFKKGMRPEIIVWGDRFFKFHSHQSPRNFPNPAYVEVFAVVALIPAWDEPTAKDDGPTAA